MLTNLKGYQFKESIGSGTFGEVYRAYQEVVNREVAIKIILPEFANLPDFVRRFDIEAQTIARLEHPFIVPLFDYWRNPDGAYLVMRWIRGGNLRDYLGKPDLSFDKILRILEQVTSALAVAHRHSIIHRDIKPGNILLDEEGNAYLSDFGLAHHLNQEDKGTGLSGSPAYLPPEQIKSEAPSPQGDIYSLGIVMYEMLTGQHPYNTRDLNLLIRGHLVDPLPDPRVLNPQLPEGIYAILQRATAKEVAERYENVMQLMTALRELAGDQTTETLLPSPEIKYEGNPYKGLRPFDETDNSKFFGRELLVKQLLASLQADELSSHFMALVGPSGSGKSSVVKAGLLPALREGAIPGSEHWFITEVLPSEQLIEELEASLLSISSQKPADLMSILQRDEKGLLQAARLILPPGGELLLVIDEFQQIFTLSDDTQRIRHFLNLIVQAVTAPQSPLRVICILRADFYDRPLRYAEFGNLLRQCTEVIIPLSRAELERAIVEPARQVGVSIEPELLNVVVSEVVEQPGALPLLQYTLTELFDLRKGNSLTFADYQSLGGIRAILAKRADAIYQNLGAEEQKLARQLFLRLVTLGEGVEDTRRRVLQTDLPTINGVTMQGVIDKFTNYRLLTLDFDPGTRIPTVEVAHESLIREWGLLHQWVQENRDDIRTQRLLASSAAEWYAADQDPSYLLRGARLAHIQEWSASTQIALTRQEQQFLLAGIAAYESEMTQEQNRQTRELQLAQETFKAEKRRVQQLRIFVRVLGLGGVILIAVTGLAIFLGIQSRQNADEAQHRANIARALTLATQADLEMQGSLPERAILLSLAALDDFPYTWQAERALTQAVLANRLEQVINQDSPINYAAFSPSGNQVALAEKSGRVLIWDIPSQQIVFSIASSDSQVMMVVFSPNGRYLLATGFDGKVRVWDTSSYEMVNEITHDSVVYHATFSNDSAYVISASYEGALKIWDVRTGAIQWDFRDNRLTKVRSLALSPDGQSLLTTSTNSIYIWDLALKTERAHLSYANGYINDANFSPDGQHIASAHADNTIGIWSVASEELNILLSGHTAAVNTVAYNFDGSQIVSASDDNTARVWNASTGAEIYTLSGHIVSVSSAQFDSQSRAIVTAGQDGTARIWKSVAGLEGQVIGHHDQLINAVAFSPDQHHLASASWDRTVKIWDIETGQLVTELPHEGWVNDVAYSSDGKLIATADRNGLALLWDVQSGQILQRYAEHTSIVQTVAISPDNRWVASGSSDHVVRIWEAATGETQLVFDYHTAEVSDVVFSPDGLYVASVGFDGNAFIFDRETGEILHTFGGQAGGLTSVDYSTDGKYLATGGVDHIIRVWDIKKNKLAFTLVGHTDVVNAVQFSHNSNRLVSVSDDSTIRLWDLKSHRTIISFSVGSQDINAVDFNPSDTWVAAAGNDGIVRRWQVWPTVDALKNFANDCCVFRELTESERIFFDVGG
ncbi:MAG: protein kinase [Chloroflexi bacterium]|nr:protein kinase [Chloroflexota bacterium]